MSNVDADLIGGDGPEVVEVESILSATWNADARIPTLAELGAMFSPAALERARSIDEAITNDAMQMLVDRFDRAVAGRMTNSGEWFTARSAAPTIGELVGRVPRVGMDLGGPMDLRPARERRIDADAPRCQIGILGP